MIEREREHESLRESTRTTVKLSHLESNTLDLSQMVRFWMQSNTNRVENAFLSENLRANQGGRVGKNLKI